MKANRYLVTFSITPPWVAPPSMTLPAFTAEDAAFQALLSARVDIRSDSGPYPNMDPSGRQSIADRVRVRDVTPVES